MLEQTWKVDVKQRERLSQLISRKPILFLFHELRLMFKLDFDSVFGEEVCAWAGRQDECR